MAEECKFYVHVYNIIIHVLNALITIRSVKYPRGSGRPDCQSVPDLLPSSISLS